jgi:hypothetical protein
VAWGEGQRGEYRGGDVRFYRLCCESLARSLCGRVLRSALRPRGGNGHSVRGFGSSEETPDGVSLASLLGASRAATSQVRFLDVEESQESRGAWFKASGYSQRSCLY